MQQQNEEITVRVRQAEQTAREAQERVRMTTRQRDVNVSDIIDTSRLDQ